MKHKLFKPLLLALIVLVTVGLASRGRSVQQPTYGQLATPMHWKESAEIQPPYTPAVRLTEPDDTLIRGALVQRDTTTNQVRRVRGRVRVAGAKTPEQAARGFLTANAKALGLSAGLTELRKTRGVSSLAGSHVTFEQVYGGLPVFGGRLSVHMDKNLAVRTVNQDLVPMGNAVGLPPAPNNSGPAVAAAVAAVNHPSGPWKTPVAVAGVKVVNGAPVPVWKVTFPTHNPGASWEVFVDAATNQALSVRNVAKYVDGSGMVFLPNPVNSSGISNLTDNNNADSVTLTAQRFPVVLQELDGSNTLSGPYISTAITGATPRANEPTHVFNYTRSSSKFEEVMCYYHVDTIERYIQSLGFNNIQNRQVPCDANNGDPNFYNAYYDPFDLSINFGAGGVDFAEDADVIWHECGHAIQDNQVPGWGSSQEGGAMGEGFGDYWACSYHATLLGPRSPDWDIYLGTWVSTGFFTGDPAYTRVVNSTKHYPEDTTGEVHDDGEIWSACLWQIRELVGKARADTLILEAHFSVSPFGSFADGANAILFANDDISGGQDGAEIRQIFEDRGILSAPPPPPVLTFFAVNNGALYTATRSVKLYSVVLGQADFFMASEDPSFAGANWQAFDPFEPSPFVIVSPGNGAKTVYFKVANASGESGAWADTIYLMEKPAVTSFSINGGASTTASKTVTLDNTCTGSPSMYLASENSSFYGATWKPYSTAPSFTLSGGIGYKRVYFKVRNTMGESPSVNRIIYSSTR